MKKLENRMCLVNAYDRDKIGFQITICQQTDCYVEQLESWFDAGHLALFPIVVMHCQCTCGCQKANNSALALLFSVREINKATVQIELRHVVKHVPDNDTIFCLLGLSCTPLCAGEKSTDQKQNSVLGSDASTCF